MNHRNAAFTCALQAAAGILACSPLDLQVAKEASTHLEDKQFGRLMALLGDTCLIKAGHAGSFPQQLYCRLWTAPTWESSYDTLVAPVRDALAVSRIKKAGPDTLSTIASRLPSLGRSGSGPTDGVLSLLTSLALTGGVVGSGVGALNWHLKRMTQGDDEKVEELDSKADFYRQVADQINTDQRLRRWQQGAQQ